MAALQINWETIQILAKTDAVVTGSSSAKASDTEAPSPFASLDRPVVVFVADPGVALSDFENLQDVVFKNEKIGLAMKAFRAVRMSPENAEKDPILGREGKTVPRMMIVDPAKGDVIVLEESKIKTSSLYKAMKTVADRFYKEKIDALVKDHLKILGDHDKLAGEEKILREKETRLTEEGDKSEKDLAELKKAIEALTKEIEDLAAKERGPLEAHPEGKAGLTPGPERIPRRGPRAFPDAGRGLSSTRGRVLFLDAGRGPSPAKARVPRRSFPGGPGCRGPSSRVKGEGPPSPRRSPGRGRPTVPRPPWSPSRWAEVVCGLALLGLAVGLTSCWQAPACGPAPCAPAPAPLLPCRFPVPPCRSRAPRLPAPRS